MKLNQNNILLMFRALEDVVAGAKIEVNKRGIISIGLEGIPMKFVVGVTGFTDRSASAPGVIEVNPFRPGDNGHENPVARKELVYDSAANVGAMNDLVAKTAKAMVAALLPVALSTKRGEIKLNENP